MTVLLFIFVIFVWLCGEQERFIGNLQLDNDQETKFFLPNVYSKNISLIMLSIFALANVFQAESHILGWTALACSFAFMARLQDWHSMELLKNSCVWKYYVILCTTAISFVFFAASLLFFTEYVAISRQILLICTALWGYITLLWWWTWMKN